VPRLAGAHHQRDRKALSGSQRHDETAECKHHEGAANARQRRQQTPLGGDSRRSVAAPQGVIAPRLPYGLEADFT
jgi:hypothetical protein